MIQYGGRIMDRKRLSAVRVFFAVKYNTCGNSNVQPKWRDESYFRQSHPTRMFRSSWAKTKLLGGRRGKSCFGKTLWRNRHECDRRREVSAEQSKYSDRLRTLKFGRSYGTPPGSEDDECIIFGTVKTAYSLPYRRARGDV